MVATGSNITDQDDLVEERRHPRGKRDQTTPRPGKGTVGAARDDDELLKQATEPIMRSRWRSRGWSDEQNDATPNLRAIES